ncbi:MAG: hypothetical protein OXH08_02275 [Gammaproteobacteria bacterium]|nr:hypothetical protein [Gammaproteobacteria bacterium]MDE0650307.1 hypothetical protein [Gammaproteobacteria bacterium]
MNVGAVERVGWSGWALVAMVAASAVLVFASRAQSPAAGSCAALEAEAGEMAREAALLVESHELFASIVEMQARTADGRALARTAAEFVGVARGHARRAAQLAAQVAQACGAGE